MLDLARKIILFGVKSPLTVDYEETIRRSSLELTAAISIDRTVRLWRREKLVTLQDCAENPPAGGFIACAFTPSNRRRLCEMAIAQEFEPHPGLIDPTAVIAESAQIGIGSFVNAAAVIGGMCRVGAHVVVNRAASIGHHSIVDDFASLGPGVTLAGNVQIGQHACIGAGAVVLPDIRIGDHAIVAAGAVVRRHVRAGTVVSGHPAKVIRLAPRSTVLGQNAQE